jgi:isopenicillin N synthase-like dioxygenase
MRVLNVDYRSSQAPELFSKSLKETGFAVLNHHPISPELVNEAYARWQDFFSSGEHKFSYLTQKPGQDGYFPFLSENAKDRKISDLKEFFHFYPSSNKTPPELKEITFKMYNALSGLAAELLQWIENCMPQEVSARLKMPLKNMIQDSPNTLLRVLHYPPIEGDVEPGAERASAHEDINLITLLPAATAPGLEVKDVHGNWHAVNCDPGNIVVNVGDMLQMCTQHYYKSTTHRVVNPSDVNDNHSRYSMPLFLHPCDEVQLSDEYTAFEYKMERLRAIGIY